MNQSPSSSHISHDEHSSPGQERLGHARFIEDVDEESQDGSGSAADDWSDAEVTVEVGGRQWYVSGVSHNTTAEEVTSALTSTLNSDGDSGGWSLCERWRGVCRPLPPRVLVLDVCKAWGLAPFQPTPHLTHADDVGLCLRYFDDDSGRESCGDPGDVTYPNTRRKKLDDNFSRLKHIIATQSSTIHRQIDKLRERERQIGEIEFEEHMTRVHKHGDNYLLDAYFRSTEGGNSDSGVGLEGNKPHRNKHRSRRSRQLLREHYLTKELTDICQVNSTMLKRTPLADEQHEQIYIIEKIAIVNKRLQHEEELLIRLQSKIKRYEQVDEKATDVEIVSKIKQLDQKIDENQKCIESFDRNLSELESEIRKRNDLLMSMYEELKTLDSEKLPMENDLPDNSINVYSFNEKSAYKLDTLV